MVQSAAALAEIHPTAFPQLFKDKSPIFGAHIPVCCIFCPSKSTAIINEEEKTNHLLPLFEFWTFSCHKWLALWNSCFYPSLIFPLIVIPLSCICRFVFYHRRAILSKSHLTAKIHHRSGVMQSQQASQEHHNGFVWCSDCMANIYWSQITPKGDTDVCIPPAGCGFTAVGWEEVRTPVRFPQQEKKNNNIVQSIQDNKREWPPVWQVFVRRLLQWRSAHCLPKRLLWIEFPLNWNVEMLFLTYNV